MSWWSAKENSVKPDFLFFIVGKMPASGEANDKPGRALSKPLYRGTNVSQYVGKCSVLLSYACVNHSCACWSCLRGSIMCVLELLAWIIHVLSSQCTLLCILIFVQSLPSLGVCSTFVYYVMMLINILTFLYAQE